MRLTQERSGLRARIDQLTVRSQELAANVQQLERQSPCML
jgi:outer membrane murein-binding lipoprotein Lpp